jgi:Putative Flp pilus-assembly TadE/G-like
MSSDWFAALKSRRASIAIQTALVLVALLGMVALGTEMVFLLYKHRQMQSAADAAALGAVTAMMTERPADFRAEALAIAADAGFVDGADGVTVTIENPPLSGSYAGRDDAVEVIVSQPQTLGLVNLFRSGIFNVGARAVAAAENAAEYCVLALDPSASGALTVQNNGIVANSVCGVAVNSSSASALVLSENGIIGGPVNVHGGIIAYNNSELNGTPVNQNAAIVADPYADRTIQTPPACTGQSGSGGNNATINLTAGHFCSGWNFANDVRLNLAPGAYYIDQKLIVGNNAIINGTGGVTLIVNGNYAINITNNVQLNLTAPTSGPYGGLAIFSGPTATSTVTQTFSNNAIIRIIGAIYMPNQIVDYQNNAGANPTRCTQIVGRKIYISNNVTLNNDCAYTGTSVVGSSTSRLVQ